MVRLIPWTQSSVSIFLKLKLLNQKLGESEARDGNTEYQFWKINSNKRVVFINTLIKALINLKTAL